MSDALASLVQHTREVVVVVDEVVVVVVDEVVVVVDEVVVASDVLALWLRRGCG